MTEAKNLKIAKESKGLVAHGMSACAGCGLELAMRKTMDVLGPRTIIVIPPGCAALFSGFGKETGMKIAGFQGNLENTAAYAAGIRAGLEIQGKTDINVLGFAGDGGTVDIGLQSLSGAMERGDKIIYICYDNEAYMNTGIQGSGASMMGAWTTTTPAGKLTFRKDMVKIMAAHRIPYVASASVAYVDDYMKKVAKARDCGGPAYIHVHAPCPTGWGYDPGKTIAVGKAAVQTHCWNLYEVEDGKTKLTVSVKSPKPVSDYLGTQKRFKEVPESVVAVIKEAVDKEYAELERSSQ